MPASKPAPSSAARGTVPAANRAAGTSHVRLLWLALTGLALAAIAWWFRSSDWMHERILSGSDLPALQAAARRQPDDPLVAYTLAKRYYIERRFGDASTAYERAVRLAPRSARAH